MTPTEARLLLYMQRMAGHVCTRADLLKHVWQWEDAGLTRTVDVTIARVRKQLPDGASIVTLKGIGYRYLAPPRMVD